MEQKFDYTQNEKKPSSYDKIGNNNNSSDNTNLSTLSIPLKLKTKDIKNISFQLENQNFQIIQKKKKEEISNSLIDKNHEGIEKINEIKLNEKNKENSKKNNLIDENELYNKNPIENNNNNIYSLLNSYYKDIDINFKNDNLNNNCKNFMPKNYFQENLNKNNFPYPQYNMQNPIHYLTFMSDQNQYSNNPFITNDNRLQSFYFPKKVFTINNEYNYYFTNNINKYCYNFHNNENNKKTINNIESTFFKINLDNILKGIDTRTTVMIRHIPNKYSYKNILDEINVVCKDKYDYFYLPLDSENNYNLGYCFINFIHPLHIVYFYNIFKSRKWFYYYSYKECDISFGKYQGKCELNNNIGKNMGENEDKIGKLMIFEIKNPPKIDLFKQYYEIIKVYQPELLNEINWI